VGLGPLPTVVVAIRRRKSQDLDVGLAQYVAGVIDEIRGARDRESRSVPHDEPALAQSVLELRVVGPSIDLQECADL